MRSSTEATRLSGAHYVGFVALNVSLHCDSELECAPGAGQFEVSDLTG